MTTTRTVEWINSKGERVVATVEIVTERTINADGDVVTVPCCEWREVLERAGAVAGYDIRRLDAPQTIGTVVVAGKCGTTGIPAAQMDAIDAAKAELRATDIWQQHEAEIARSRQESAEYEAHVRRVDRMMTAGGRSY